MLVLLPRDSIVVDIGDQVRHKTHMKAVFTQRRVDEDAIIAEKRRANAQLLLSQKMEEERIYVHVWTKVRTYQY